MGWTKRQILNDAFSEIGMAGYVFDLEPDDLQTALNRLDSLMSQWESDNIYTGYAVTDDPASISIDGDSGILSQYVLPVIHNLAVQIAPSYGKQPMPQTMAAARKGYAVALRTKTVPMKSANITVTPAGSGNTRRIDNYLDRYLEPDS
jgi:hypothetical protein